MRSLPLAARIYVSAVIIAGALVAVLFAPRATFEQPFLFTLLLFLSVISMASLAITVQAAGLAYAALGGVSGEMGNTLPRIAGPLIAAATVYFIFNTLFIAIAIGLSTKQSVLDVWNENFLW